MLLLSVCPPQTYQDYRDLISSVDDFSLALGWLLVVINVAIWIPQIVDLFRTRSAVGISISSFFLAAFTANAAVVNIIFSDWYSLKSCAVIGSECLPRILPTVQYVCYSVLAAFCYMLALYTHVRYDKPRYAQLEEQAARAHGQVFDPNSSPLTANFLWGMNFAATVEVFVFWLGSAALLLVGFVLHHQYGACSTTLTLYAKANGTFNSIGTVFQWTPQLLTTYQLKHKGSLSLSMIVSNMLLDCLTTVYMVRLHENWATWSANAVDFFMCCILLSLLIQYEMEDAKHGLSPDDIEAAAAAAVQAAHEDDQPSQSQGVGDTEHHKLLASSR
eukprot:TRINITY_DN938_c0_g2_i1.p1 TRINITY_DN938_c0_g2~~TRINITY_DN938_c0_g2_i1.p1  ORF type:complete len:331 (-),score=85.39 TRINITY_DN938_c0_g2_i1:376-1368(-)